MFDTIICVSVVVLEFVAWLFTSHLSSQNAGPSVLSTDNDPLKSVEKLATHQQ